MPGSTYVIAEMGSCHDGKLKHALALIEAAAQAGADAIKAQWWSDADRLAERRRVGDDYRALYRRYQVPQRWLEVLATEAHAAGLDFLCTVYLPEDVEVVAPLVERGKVASFELGAADLFRAWGDVGKPLIVSTGMATVEEVNRIALRADDWLLHCVSAYPCPDEAAGLAGIAALRRAWPTVDRVGYSDHTTDLLTGALAVAAGADVLEKHLRLGATDRANPDHATALDPDEFRRYVAGVRWAERVLGPAEKAPHAVEAAMAAYRVAVEGRP